MIRFPKMHIAKSVVNRIMNIADEIDTQSKLDSLQIVDIPSIPEGTPEGTAIDARLSMPTPEVAAPPGVGITDALGPEKIL